MCRDHRPAQRLSAFDDAPCRQEVFTTELPRLVGVLQGCLNGFVVITSADNRQCRVERNPSLLDCD